MQIQTNTDRNIESSEGLAAAVRTVVDGALARFGGHITRVEVHLSDENGARGGAEDKRCMMEARLEGRQPTAVTHQAATLEQALVGAARKLRRCIESTLGRLRVHRRTSSRHGFEAMPATRAGDHTVRQRADAPRTPTTKGMSP